MRPKRNRFGEGDIADSSPSSHRTSSRYTWLRDVEVEVEMK